MEELALHILDIAKNSTAAGAALIEITLTVDRAADLLEITVKDDGCGMPEDFLKRVTGPFATTRSTRKVGMGLPLFKHAAESTGGSLEIASKEGVGTFLKARFGFTHIDRMPLGDTAGSMAVLIGGSPEADFIFTYTVDGAVFVLDTREIKEILGGVSLGEPEIQEWLYGFIKENMQNIDGGIILI